MKLTLDSEILKALRNADLSSIVDAPEKSKMELCVIAGLENTDA